ncbi:PREDICTED: uncharacterized protein LOC107069023 [Polistes dominula]|uniref:Uncharacterized protein LOC107069023 n=1 Tax=Polistes dominula TaxID=743375 RepID=A0ABM1IMI3_POLDO|nr:PREDICTED: uncharacterized protein LOC107069023 [Polistes dominula]
MAISTVCGSNVLLMFNIAMLLCLLTDADKTDDIVQESSGGLPFLQFTNGGVRVNFAGYHAEAGLGGLLGNSQTGGGLHASAGTPFGPQASAGLGGLLSGDNANAGGGLYAQAGLGNNRPSARAGLGGILDGSGRSNYPAAGGLFAGADLGNNQPGASAGLGGVLGGNSDVTNDNVPINTPQGHTNVQIISKSASNGHKTQRAIATKSIIINEAVPETKYVNVDGINGKSAVPNADAAIGSNFETTQEPPISNRWYLRKRLRGFKKQIPVSEPIPAPSFDTSSSSASGAVSVKSSGKVISEVNADGNSDVNYVSSKAYKPGSLYDDIFNIPISTLMAVNKLLRNNEG